MAVFFGGLVVGSCLGIDLVWFLTVAVGFCRLRWFGWCIVWFRYIVGGSLCCLLCCLIMLICD